MLSYRDIQKFLYAESRAQSEKRWDDWLAFYSNDVLYHVPSWDDDDTLISDPQSEVSLIYYPNRQGLEDRVFRIGTERSSATIPDTRYNRDISNLEILQQDDNLVDLCFNWTTHTFRFNITDIYFGTARYKLDTSGDRPLITSKYVVLKNDYVHHMLDVYHL